MSRPSPSDRILRALAPCRLGASLAAAAGPVLDAGFPERGWWPLAFVGDRAGARRAQRPARRIGRCSSASSSALTFYLPHIEWAALFLGPVPWSALVDARWRSACALGARR